MLRRNENAPAHSSAWRCCGVRIDAISMDEAVRRITLDRGRRVLHLCNSYTLSLARKSESYARILNAGDVNLADGTPLAWIGSRQIPGAPRRAIRGPDLMREAFIAGQASGTGHYLYGSTDATLDRLREAIAVFAPEARVVGAHSPPFSSLSDHDFSEAAEKMTSARADVIWVGLGTPKQDWAASALGAHCDAVVVPVGAAFDFLAGTTKEAPRILRGTGLEWVFRLFSEPRRLWRRYLFGNVGFVYGLLRNRPQRIE